MNLIEQMNVLKGLSDEQLTAELRSPSGGAAPYMVASEIGRRKDMRQRYEAEAARKAERTTVMDDLVGGAMQGTGGGLPAAGMQGMPRVMPRVMPTGLEAAAPKGYADGGLVDAVDYNDIASRFMQELDTTEEQKAQAAALALIAAGAGMMSGGHASTLRNIGEGASKGVSAYTDALKTITSDDLAAMRGLSEVGQAQHAEELARLQEDRMNRQLAAQEAAANAPPGPTADMLNYKFRESLTDEQKKVWDAQHANPNALNVDQIIGPKMDAIYQDAQKKFPLPDPSKYLGAEPIEQVAAEQLRKAQADAYNRIKATFGPEYAAQWAAGMGIPVGDLVLLDAGAGTGGTGKAPVPYTEYSPG